MKIPDYSIPVAIDSDTDALLKNWARWCRHYPRRARCLSMEGRYKSPQEWDEKLTNVPRTPPDIQDAVRVEIACCKLPVKHHLALKFTYVLPWIDPWKAARLSGWYRPEKMEQASVDAARMVKNILRDG